MTTPTNEELLQENKEAIASGARRVQYDDHELEYHSIDQQLQARQLLKKEAEASPKRILRWTVARCTKGL